MGKTRIFTLIIITMMVCSLALFSTPQVDAAVGPVTHYNVDLIQKPCTVGLTNSLIVIAADSTNATVQASRVAKLTSSDPNAILPTNTTLVFNDNGIAGGVSIHFGTAGTQTLTVTDTTDNTIVGILTVTVAPIHFSVSVTPTTITAGESVNVTVTALDASENVLTTIGNSGYGSSIDFSSTDSQAVFPLQGSPSNMINGIGVFNITLNTTGSHTITVVNKAFPLVNATTNAITVNANVTATPTASPTPTPETTLTPTASPTSTPTTSPTATAMPAAQTADNSQTNNLIIIAVAVIAVIVAVIAVVFLRKKRSQSSNLPPPPPPPPT